MSSLKSRRAAVCATVPVMHPLSDQLDTIRGAIIAAARQPDSAKSRAALRRYALASAFVIDSIGCHPK